MLDAGTTHLSEAPLAAATTAEVGECPLCHQEWDGLRSALAARADKAGLTARETQVVYLIGRAHSNAEIARELGLSINSVKTYIRTAYRKLDVDSRAAAILWARGFRTPHPGTSRANS